MQQIDLTEEHNEDHDSHEGENAWDIFTDPAHFVAELAYEGIFFILGVIYVRIKLRARDKAHHHYPHADREDWGEW